MSQSLERGTHSVQLLVGSPSDFRLAVQSWFSNNARLLPWRETKDPYRIWLSEIILQQTRVDQAIPYYDRLLLAFPTVQELASASIDDILKLWEGLGYYSRARNLHRAAKRVVDEFDGELPTARTVLLDLPGIGTYTAAAILSIAHGHPFGVVDGNVTRVLSRLIAFNDDVGNANSRRVIQQLMDDLLDPDDPGSFNEAIMELGAMVCLPRNPLCSQCPVLSFCRASEADPEAFPKRTAKKRIPHHEIAVAVLNNDQGDFFAQRRPENGLLGGLWEFPGGKREPGETIKEACHREVREEIGLDVEVGELVATINHAYSHFKITLFAFRCVIISETTYVQTALPHKWIAADRLSEYAFPRANRKLIDHLMESKTVA